jgi:signal transduction histidine kinase
MINLILNAIQAVNNKGTIEITIEENKDTVIIQVKDSGIGISSENLDKIFEPLFTTKLSGTGLGLVGVKSIIESHQGKISVTSPPTVFTISLPKIIEEIDD